MFATSLAQKGGAACKSHPALRGTCLGPVVLGPLDVLAPIHPVDELVQWVVADGFNIPQPMQGQDKVRTELVIGDHPADGKFLAEQQEGGGRWSGTNRPSAEHQQAEGAGAGQTD